MSSSLVSDTFWRVCRRLLLVWSAIVAVLACDREYDHSDRDDFTPEVIECEEAYARLVYCCPGFALRKRDDDHEHAGLCIDFEYERQNSYSCHGNTDHIKGHLRPSLTSDESGCIRGASCDDLVTQRTCDRARDLKALGESSGTTVVRPAVCP